MHSLPLFVRLKGRKVILLGDGEAADAKRRLLERAGAHIVTDEREGAGAGLAVVALEDAAAANSAAERLRARGLLVNVVDRPELCDFTTPAIVERGPVIIAIGTGGASAGLAKTLRQRLEALLPAGLGSVAEGLNRLRGEMRRRWPDGGDRRRAIDAALAEGGMLDPFVDHADAAVDRWLVDAAEPEQGQLAVIHLTSADPDDLTLRTARLLGRADALWHRANVPDAILNRARADAERHVADGPPPQPERGLWLWLDLPG